MRPFQSAPLSGTINVSAAWPTPGTLRSRATMSANVRVRASAGTAVRRRSTDATRTFGSKPKSTAPRFLKVRPKSTAPTTSTIERATWPTTRPRRTATASCPSVDDRPPGWSVVAGSRRVAVSAGPRPNSMQATKADATMNANRRQSGVRSTKTGAGPAFRTLTSVWLIHRASSSPPAAPRPAMSALRQELTDHPATRCANCELHGNLAAAGRGAGEHQVCQVDRGQEEHQPCRAQQHPQLRRIRPTQVRHAGRGRVGGKRERGVVLRRVRLVTRRHGRPENVRRNGGELHLRLLDGPVWSESTHDIEPPRVASAGGRLRAAQQRLGAQRDRHVERSADFDAEEPRLRDADHIEPAAVEHDRL